MSLLPVSVQYLAYIYIYFLYILYVKEWRKNPKWSLSCCLALLLPLNNLQKGIGGLAGMNVLRQQLQTGRIEMPSTVNTVRDNGAVDITLADCDVDCEKEEETTTRSGLNKAFLPRTSQYP